jgi:hypothetical protein
MEAFAAFASSVGRSFGIDPTIAASVIAALLAAFMVWLGHFVSHANAKLTASLQTDEKAAVMDMRGITLVTSAHDQWVRFKVQNFGATSARDVVVHATGQKYSTGFDAAYASIVGPSESIPLELKLPHPAVSSTEIIIELRYRDYRGRLRGGKRALSLAGSGGQHRQRGVDI